MTGDINMTSPAVIKFKTAGADTGSVYTDGNDTCVKSEAGDIRLLGSNVIISDADNGAGNIKMGVITIAQHANDSGINHLDINVGTDAGSVYINRDGMDGGTGELWLTEVHAPNELRLNPGTNINAMNHRITGVADPTQDTDALTLKYFNEHGGGGGGAEYTAGDGIKIESDVISVDPAYFTTNPQSLPYLPLAGGIMAGAITRSGELVMADANKTAIQVQNQNIGGDNSSFAVLINGAASNTNFSIRTNRTVADSTDSATVTNNIRLGLAGDRSNVVVLDMGGMPVVNMGEPTMSHDAVTLGYLQTNVGTNGPFLPLSGGTVTGATTFGSAIYGINSLLLFSKDSAASERTDILLGDTSIVVEVQDTNEFTFSADGLNMGKHKITNLAAPTQTGDAVNLGYIQTNIGTGPFLPLSGGTMTGNITGPTTWVLRSEGSNYSRIAFTSTGLNLGVNTTTTMVITQTEISASNHRITNLTTPSANTDAANKNYVDNKFWEASNSPVVTDRFTFVLGRYSGAQSINIPAQFRTASYKLVVWAGGAKITNNYGELPNLNTDQNLIISGITIANYTASSGLFTFNSDHVLLIGAVTL